MYGIVYWANALPPTVLVAHTHSFMKFSMTVLHKYGCMSLMQRTIFSFKGWRSWAGYKPYTPKKVKENKNPTMINSIIQRHSKHKFKSHK